jgi:hypothetical protein
MKAYEATALIAAPPDRVWAILADAENWPAWDSGVEKVEGRVEPGATVKVTSSVNPGRAYPVKVAEVVPGRSFTWVGGMPFGLFRGARSYSVEPESVGTRFHMREEFNGPLLPLIWRSMPDMQPSFDQFAAGLKVHAEGAAG